MPKYDVDFTVSIPLNTKLEAAHLADLREQIAASVEAIYAKGATIVIDRVSIEDD